MSSYPTQPASARYARATAALEFLVATLGSTDTNDADHSSVERLIFAEGTEVLRLLYEDWLGSQAASMSRLDVDGVDGVRRTHHRLATRQMESLFGTVAIHRDRVGAPGSSALVPTDAVLNLSNDRFSLGIRERVATEAVRGSFDATVSAMASTTGATVAKRQAEELTLAAAVDFDAFYQTVTRSNPATAAHDILVLTADGKGVVMLPSGLREATRAAAARATRTREKGAQKGEKRNRKRMAVVASVYDLANVPRTAADVLTELDRKSTPIRPRATNKRVWASLEKGPSIVIGEMFEEAERRDPSHQRRWAALVDGNATQIHEIRAAARRNGVNVTLVLDFIHVTQYIWNASKDFFEEGDDEAKRWVQRRLFDILSGKAGIAAAAMRRKATVRQLKKRSGVDAAADYLLGHLSMLQYDRFMADGLPITTGVIEGACRHLVKDRMDITGARWGLEGAEAILRLRSLYVSGDLDQYWAFHRQQEFERNHAASYADCEETWLWQRAA